MTFDRRVLLGLLLLAGCGDGGGMSRPVGEDGWPPKRYRDDTAVMVRFVSNVEAECHKGGLQKVEGSKVTGCARIGAGVREIIVANPCTSSVLSTEYTRSVCHEIGHINGWSGKHEK